MLKYLRIKLFYALMKPIAERSRRKRNALFVSLMKLKPGERVLDVGGDPTFWDQIECPLDITCINLSGIMDLNHKSHHQIVCIEGDGRSMPQFSPGQFDLIFSNSVIEHVGDRASRAKFAGEIRRLGNRYWVQTPCKYFPIEAHCGMPFWWFYPRTMRARLIERWRRNLPAWTEMVESTDVLERGELATLFPGSRIRTEWLVFPKSLIAHTPARE